MKTNTEIYHFRVLPDAAKGVFRDIEIPSDQTFLDLHNILLESFAFKNDEMASFYLSNEEWEKGAEITLMDMSDDGEADTMDETVLSDVVGQPGSRLLYLYDFMRLWIFYVELVGVSEPDPDAQYPRVVLAVGDAPDERSKEMESSIPVENQESLSNSEDDEFDEPFDDSEDYENL